MSLSPNAEWQGYKVFISVSFFSDADCFYTTYSLFFEEIQKTLTYSSSNNSFHCVVLLKAIEDK